MEKDNKDVTPFIRKATESIVKTSIKGKFYAINIFFSMKTENTYFNIFSKTHSHRLSFAKIAYYLYLKTEQTISDDELYEDDFINASDEELTIIIHAILDDDVRLKEEYDKIQESDIFIGFYIARKNVFDDEVAQLQKKNQALMNRTFSNKTLDSISKTQKLLDNIVVPKLTSELTQIIHLTENLNFPQFNIGAEVIQQHKHLMDAMPKLPIVDTSVLSSSLHITAESATRITSNFDFASVANAINLFSTRFSTILADYQGIQSVLSGIPKFAVDFSRITKPFVEQLYGISANLQAPLKSFTQALSNIDFSMLTYHKEWNEKHDALIRFGWFYLNELPDELVVAIFEKIADIKQDEVDGIIVSYFRKDKCAGLKGIVNTWKSSRYFASRNYIFNQALHCHSRGIYNASVTMLTLHIEGVITDFVRMAFNAPKFKVEKALEDINDFIGDLPFSTLTFSDWSIFFPVMEDIQIALTESFDLSNPETTSNNSRHKIAHGHAVEKESEANSLRRFLYLNELYRIFSVIDEELDSNGAVT